MVCGNYKFQKTAIVEEKSKNGSGTVLALVRV